MIVKEDATKAVDFGIKLMDHNAVQLSRQETRMQVAKMRMLRYMPGVSWKDNIMHDYIQGETWGGRD